MWKKLLASTALVAGAVCGLSAPAQAQESDRDFRLHAFGGAANLVDATHSDTYAGSIDYSLEFSFDNGFVAGVSAGFDFGDLIVEAEYARREADVEDVVLSLDGLGPVGSVSDGGEISIDTLMVNVWRQFTVSDDMQGYFGGGVGIGQGEISGNLFAETGSAEADAFLAFQLGVGVERAIADDWTIGIGYRYFNVPDLSEDTDAEIQSHDFLVEMSKTL